MRFLTLSLQALKDNNKIWAVIHTGVNQDGRTTTPITAPSGLQQTALLKTVYAHSGVDPAKVQYIEAHGQSAIHFLSTSIGIYSLYLYHQNKEYQR